METRTKSVIKSMRDFYNTSNLNEDIIEEYESDFKLDKNLSFKENIAKNVSKILYIDGEILNESVMKDFVAPKSSLPSDFRKSFFNSKQCLKDLVIYSSKSIFYLWFDLSPTSEDVKFLLKYYKKLESQGYSVAKSELKEINDHFLNKLKENNYVKTLSEEHKIVFVKVLLLFFAGLTYVCKKCLSNFDEGRTQNINDFIRKCVKVFNPDVYFAKRSSSSNISSQEIFAWSIDRLNRSDSKMKLTNKTIMSNELTTEVMIYYRGH